MRCYQETGEPEYPCNGSNGTQRSMGTVRLAEEPSPSVQTAARRLKIDEENIKNGLAQLVMTLIKLLHELLERQAIQRMESDSLDEGQIERLGADADETVRGDPKALPGFWT